jgi:hypothetical protein
MRDFLERELNEIKQLNSSKISDYFQMKHHSAAVVIQALYRGYLVRKYGVDGKGLKQENPRELLETQSQSDNYIKNLVTFVDKIKQKSKPNRDFYISPKDLHEKCRLLDKMLAKKTWNRWVSPDINLVELANQWLDACEPNRKIPNHKGPTIDPTLNLEIRNAHKQAMVNAKEGWWKEISSECKWNDRDPDFESWIQEIESGIIMKEKRYY